MVITSGLLIVSWYYKVIILVVIITAILYTLWAWDKWLKLSRSQLNAQLELKALRDYYKYLFHYANDIIILTDNNFNIVEINEKALQSYNYKREDLIGMNSSILIAPCCITVNLTYRNLLIETGSAFYETRHISKDGLEFPIEISTRLIEIEGNKFFQSIGRDNTERKHAEEEIVNLNMKLEQRIIHRTAQLEASNKDLESFSYSVSHDLRAPLRSIDSYTNILIEKYGHLLDEEGRRICTAISSNGVKMRALIDDLLLFSKIGRSSMNIVLLDMECMARKVFSDTATEKEKLKVKLTIGRMDKAPGDPKLIMLVLNNLISNALKYTSRRADPEIEIGSRAEDGKIVYFVKDNGIGFEMQFSQKIFEVFERLHNENEFDGNGVGLAIVHKIILTHNGKVWAYAEPGKGATFYFSMSGTPDTLLMINEDCQHVMAINQ